MTEQLVITREFAEEYTAALKQTWAGGWRFVLLGDRAGIPKALGLSTREWVENELGGYVKLSIPDRREAARELVEEEGLSQRQAAEVLGVGVGTVNRDLAVPDGTAAIADEVQEDELDVPGGTPEPTSQPPKPHVAYNSGENEWYTPRKIVDTARLVLGEIDLDPASTPEANTVVGASTFYTAEDDGLAQEWSGRVFMNPPYEAGLIDRFVEKLVTSYNVTESITLVNNATETEWFQKLAKRAKAICFPKKRVRFWGPDGKASAPLQGQAIVYHGDEPVLFASQFRSVGVIVYVV